jgi:hypothetical protein
LKSIHTSIFEKATLKVHKGENFFGSDFELFTFFWLVMPNYSFLEIVFFLLDQYDGRYDHSAYTQYTRKEVFPAS